MKKRIVFACSSGIATSTLVANKTVDYCKKNGIDVDYQQSTVGELPGLDGTVDLFVVTSNVGGNYKTPVINALPVITGIGEDEVLNKVISILKD